DDGNRLLEVADRYAGPLRYGCDRQRVQVHPLGSAAVHAETAGARSGYRQGARLDANILPRGRLSRAGHTLCAPARRRTVGCRDQAPGYTPAYNPRITAQPGWQARAEDTHSVDGFTSARCVVPCRIAARWHVRVFQASGWRVAPLSRPRPAEIVCQ